MGESENEKNGVIQSQKSLFLKLKKINKIFNTHFFTLNLFFLLVMGLSSLWTYLLVTGQIIFDLALRYGLFGTIVSIIQITVLFLLIIQLGTQIIFYGLFIIRGNRSLKQDKENKEKTYAQYNGIVPYISNFCSFFNRYSKEKKSLIKLVNIFLSFNFLFGFYIVFLFTRLLDTYIGINAIKISMTILFLLIVVCWLINLVTTAKIKKEFVKWEDLFPKLEEWAQSLDKFELNDSKSFNKK